MPNPAAAKKDRQRGGTRTRSVRDNPGLENDELSAQIQRLQSREGSADAALTLVLTENKKYRERHREDSEYIAELEENQVPEGSVPVTKEDSDLLTAFKAINKKPEEITSILKEHSDLKVKDAKTTLEKANAAAAKEVGYNPETLNELLDAKGQVIEMKEVSVVNGDKTEKKMVPHVRPAASKPGENLRPLTEAVKSDWPVWDAALRAKVAEGGSDTDANSETEFTDTTFVSQKGGATGSQQPNTIKKSVDKTLAGAFADNFPPKQ